MKRDGIAGGEILPQVDLTNPEDNALIRDNLSAALPQDNNQPVLVGEPTTSDA